jgi:rfaE bifunctional protein nucleotidyltransferase chain/domain
MQSTKAKIQTLDQLLAKVQAWRDKGNKIVFTNGCFDILHLGHVDYLERSKAEGDVLVVGINSDESVKRLKGDERPLQNQESRSRVIAALGCVDAVVLFGEDTPLNLILAIGPDVLVKGADYTEEQVVGAKEVVSRGGKLVLIPFVEGFSTTRIVNRMKQNP